MQVFDASLTQPVGLVLRHAYLHDLNLSQLEIDGDGLNVSGVSVDWEMCVALEQLLAESGYQVTLAKGDVKDGRVGFTLTAAPVAEGVSL